MVIPRKQWLSPDMTEKLLSGMLSINTNKQTSKAQYLKLNVSDVIPFFVDQLQETFLMMSGFVGWYIAGYTVPKSCIVQSDIALYSQVRFEY